jgi:hypothetical protein
VSSAFHQTTRLRKSAKSAGDISNANPLHINPRKSA